MLAQRLVKKLMHVFIVNTEKTVNRNKIITVYSDFAFACLINSRITIFIMYLQVYVENHYNCKQTGFFPKIQQYLLFWFNCLLQNIRRGRFRGAPYFPLIPFWVYLLILRLNLVFCKTQWLNTDLGVLRLKTNDPESSLS